MRAPPTTRLESGRTMTEQLILRDIITSAGAEGDSEYRALLVRARRGRPAIPSLSNETDGMCKTMLSHARMPCDGTGGDTPLSEPWHVLPK